MPLNKNVSTLLRTGFFHIFGAGSLNKVLTACLSIALVRILSIEDYGVYSYAFNIASFFIIFNGLGATSAALQICIELGYGTEKSNALFSFAYKVGIVSDVALAIVILLVGAFMPLAISGSNLLLMLYCLYPLVTFLCQLKLTQLRIALENKEYAFMTNVQTVNLVVFSLAGAMANQAPGLIVAQCLAYFVTYCFLVIRHPFRRADSVAIGRRERWDFWKIALISCVNNGLGEALMLFGTFLVGAILANDRDVAIFKVASTIPFALIFLPGMVATYVYPYFVRHAHDREWTSHRYRQLILCMSIGSGVITIVCVIFANPIITILFGDQYLNSVLPFQIMMVGFWITTSFRHPTGNLLVTQRKLVFNMVVGIVSLVTTAVLGIILVHQFSLIGAAVTYTATMFIGACLNVLHYLNTIRRI